MYICEIMSKEDNKVHLDTRLVLKGKPGEFLREKLTERKENERRSTYSNTVEAILLKHFKWDKQ